MPIFSTGSEWRIERPRVLVVACSDGRLQMQIDEFLAQGLGVTEYDRLYLPGGPGALATSGLDYSRADRAIAELSFLLDAHRIEEVLLLFHGPGEGGPIDAVCADYVRKLGQCDAGRVRAQQEEDADEVLRRAFGFRRLKVRTLFCEVRADRRLDIVEYDPASGHSHRQGTQG
ncbi:MAG: hypothetical protein KIS66_01440 [Fimbriimonadaceae bacterium]|nr:hypothetical protein [Fimbriimonadaceae bacterium]